MISCIGPPVIIVHGGIERGKKEGEMEATSKSDSLARLSSQQTRSALQEAFVHNDQT